jgi:hypothetical protein
LVSTETASWATLKYPRQTLVSHLEYNVHYRGRVHWLPHPERGLESHLVGGCDGRFIEAMAQTSN